MELKTCFVERMGEIRVPTLIIHGEKDSLVPLADKQKAARKIANARLEVIAWGRCESSQRCSTGC